MRVHAQVDSIVVEIRPKAQTEIGDNFKVPPPPHTRPCFCRPITTACVRCAAGVGLLSEAVFHGEEQDHAVPVQPENCGATDPAPVLPAPA